MLNPPDRIKLKNLTCQSLNLQKRLDPGKSQLEPHYTKDCLYSGHSDTCWMPTIGGAVGNSRADQELDTLNSSLIGYSKEKFSRLTQHYCNIKSANTLAPSSDLQSQRSSGYLSSNEGGQQRSIHYC